MKAPRAERIHIGILGRRNAGKSSLINTLTGQQSSIVSDVLGTTTDPIYKPMEIHGVGPVVFIDTAGYDDVGELGMLRVKKTEQVLEKCDGYIFLLSSEEDLEYIEKLRGDDIPIIFVLPKADLSGFQNLYEIFSDLNPLPFISSDEDSKKRLLDLIITKFMHREERSITEGLVVPGDVVLLVVPQDIQAPKGRLILPQVQTIRELLDKGAVPMMVTLDNLRAGLDSLGSSPNLVITDSQCFKPVYESIPEGTPLTSFSVLFSAYKGDIDYFIESVKVLDKLGENGRILISEACTHPPLEEDIGRVKIPMMLRKKYGERLSIDFVRGDDFNDIGEYDLIILCGSCMFNRQHVMSRVAKAKQLGIPMTNYGITIAYLTGILNEIALP